MEVEIVDKKGNKLSLKRFEDKTVREFFDRFFGECKISRVYCEGMKRFIVPRYVEAVNTFNKKVYDLTCSGCFYEKKCHEDCCICSECDGDCKLIDLVQTIVDTVIDGDSEDLRVDTEQSMIDCLVENIGEDIRVVLLKGQSK